jgi:serine/threonine protein kinase
MPPSQNIRRRRTRSANRKNTQRRNNTRRAKSLERNKNINAEELGFGAYGIVSRPPAKCARFLNNENISTDLWREAYYGNPNYISKLTEYTNALHELEIANIIRKNIPNYENYFCLTEFICYAPESKIIYRGSDYMNTYAVAPYCGVTLLKVIESDYPMNIFELCNLIPAAQHFIRGVLKLHTLGIYHKDIHEENVLYDRESGSLRLIDFGLAENLTDIKNKNSSIIISSELHDSEQIVNNIIRPLVGFLLDSRISDDTVRETYKFINNFYYQLRDFYGSITSTLNPRGQERLQYVNNEEKLNRHLQVILKLKELHDVYYFTKGFNNNE